MLPEGLAEVLETFRMGKNFTDYSVHISGSTDEEIRLRS